MPDDPAKPPAPNNLVKHLIAAVFTIVLLWLAFKDCNWAQLWHYLRSVHLLPVVGLCVSALLSHLLRAYRWIFLLQPLSEKKIGLFNSFFAVILGYAVNVAIPRGGEVARLLSICRTEGLPWAGVLSTMLIDRMLDLAMLVFLLGSCLLVLPKDLLASMPWLVPGGISILISTVIGLLVLPWVGGILAKLLALKITTDRVPEKLREKLATLAEQFDTGTKSLKSPVKYPIIAFVSVVIWFFYWLNFYLMVFAFDLQSKIDPLKCLIIFTIGSLGVLVPTPGSVGGFHVLVSRGMTMTADVPPDQALAFATLLHFVAFVWVACAMALLLWVVRGKGNYASKEKK